MKILAINGSPNRDGSTARVIDMLLKECSKLGATCERINIEDYSIFPCKECRNCKNDTECLADDDYIQLKARMLDADAVIIGSPYYSASPVIALKTFIQRLTYSAFFKKEFMGKYMVGVSTSAVDDSSEIANYCANLGFKNYMGGFIVTGTLCEHMVLEEGFKEFEDDNDVKDNVKNTAERLVEHFKSNFRPKYYDYLNKLFNKRLNYTIIRIIRINEQVTTAIKRFLTEKGLIKDSNKISE